jgi:hypothetical protein
LIKLRATAQKNTNVTYEEKLSSAKENKSIQIYINGKHNNHVKPLIIGK